MTVDEFVETKVLPEFKDLVNELRRLIKEVVPKATEQISYGIPAYKLRKILAVISPTKKDITLSFAHGKQFEDKYKLLNGVGKASQHIKFKKIEDLNKEVLKYYFDQEIKISNQ